MEQSVGHLSLSELTNKIRKTIQDAFSGNYYWVVGEVSGHKFYQDTNKHFLDLVEKLEGQSVEAAKIKTSVWSDASPKISEFEKLTGQEFKDGLQVLVKVKVNFHIVHGLSLSILEIDASYTLGKMEKQRLDTLMRLVKENPDKISQSGEEFITANKNLKLPLVIQKIALVASSNSEGLHDFMKNIRDNHFGYSFEIDAYFSSVQGTTAAEELRNSMLKIYKSGIVYDVVVIVRGGGAKTDFAVFDTYGIAQAVARFPFPVITGIGHLRDVSITDLMAHTVTNAPTKAAEFIVAYNRMFEDGLVGIQRNIVIKTQRLTGILQRQLSYLHTNVVNSAGHRLQQNKEYLQQYRMFAVEKSRGLLSEQRHGLTFLYSKINTTLPFSFQSRMGDLEKIKERVGADALQLLKTNREFLTHQHSFIRAMNPKNILSKGFVLVKQCGKIKTNTEEMKEGDELSISFSNAEIIATIKQITDGEYEL